jgi:hypothetical protein
MSTLGQIDAQWLIERVAERVVEMLEERAGDSSLGGQLVSAATLANLLGISRSCVYEHADRLGAIELGNGTRPRLRFDVDQAREAWTRRVRSGESEGPGQPTQAAVSRRRRSTAARSEVDLLPIRVATGA